MCRKGRSNLSPSATNQHQISKPSLVSDLYNETLYELTNFAVPYGNLCPHVGFKNVFFETAMCYLKSKRAMGQLCNLCFLQLVTHPSSAAQTPQTPDFAH